MGVLGGMTSRAMSCDFPQVCYLIMYVQRSTPRQTLAIKMLRSTKIRTMLQSLMELRTPNHQRLSIIDYALCYISYIYNPALRAFVI